MPHRDIVGLLVTVLATAALVGCSDQSPAAPSTSAAVPSGAPDAQPVPGSYTLYLATTSGQVVPTLPVGGPGPHELLLWAQVRDGSGGLAPSGSVIFQACRRGGADYTAWRPSADCDSGTAAWAHVATVKVDGCPPFAPENGNACITFGAMANPMTIGFRFRYVGQGSGIANGESASQDMTWVAVP